MHWLWEKGGDPVRPVDQAFFNGASSSGYASVVQPSHRCDCDPPELLSSLKCSSTLPLKSTAVFLGLWFHCDFPVFNSVLVWLLQSHSQLLVFFNGCWASLMLKTSENTILQCPGIQKLGERDRKICCSFFILNEVIICFLCHPHVSGGLIHDVGTLVAGGAATDFKGLWLRLKCYHCSFYPRKASSWHFTKMRWLEVQYHSPLEGKRPFGTSLTFFQFQPLIRKPWCKQVWDSLTGFVISQAQ